MVQRLNSDFNVAFTVRHYSVYIYHQQLTTPFNTFLMSRSTRFWIWQLAQLLKVCHAYYGNGSFITVKPRTTHQPILCATTTQPTPLLFFFGFPANFIYKHLISAHACYVPHPTSLFSPTISVTFIVPKKISSASFERIRNKIALFVVSGCCLPVHTITWKTNTWQLPATARSKYSQLSSTFGTFPTPWQGYFTWASVRLN